MLVHDILFDFFEVSEVVDLLRFFWQKGLKWEETLPTGRTQKPASSLLPDSAHISLSASFPFRIPPHPRNPGPLGLLEWFRTALAFAQCLFRFHRSSHRFPNPPSRYPVPPRRCQGFRGPSRVRLRCLSPFYCGKLGQVTQGRLPHNTPPYPFELARFSASENPRGLWCESVGWERAPAYPAKLQWSVTGCCWRWYPLEACNLFEFSTRDLQG